MHAGGAAASSALREEAFPALPATAPHAPPPSGSASSSGGAGGGKKGKKQSLNSFMQAPGRAHPQNPWKNPGLRGTWAGGGALAQEERALLEGWGKKK
jgi:hypothetical protein